MVSSRASENTSSASNGRLNNADNAWCFSYDVITADKVTFTVDLGSLHLVMKKKHMERMELLH